MFACATVVFVMLMLIGRFSATETLKLTLPTMPPPPVMAGVTLLTENVRVAGMLSRVMFVMSTLVFWLPAVSLTQNLMS